MNKGDIIIVPFPFTDLSGNKLRPAVVLVSGDEDVTVAFITTQAQWKEAFDMLVLPSSENGLKKESLIRLSKLATIDKDLLIGLLGKLDNADIKIMNNNLKMILKLDQ